MLDGMANVPRLWLHCDCGLTILSENKMIAPRSHPIASAKRMCPGRKFTIDVTPDPETIRRAQAELQRRTKKHGLRKLPTKRAYKQGPGTNPWDGVRATTARPSKGTAGAPTLGKNSR